MKYSANMLKYIETGRDIEIKGLNFYKKSLKHVFDPNSARLLKFLISEEGNHLEYFNNLKKQYTKGKVDVKVTKLKSPLFHKKDYKKIHGREAYSLNIFTIALEMEAIGMKFYTQFSKKAKDKKIKKFFKDLAQMESNHFNLIKEHENAIHNFLYWEAMEAPRIES